MLEEYVKRNPEKLDELQQGEGYQLQWLLERTLIVLLIPKYSEKLKNCFEE
jgi:hypothetical protein